MSSGPAGCVLGRLWSRRGGRSDTPPLPLPIHKGITERRRLRLLLLAAPRREAPRPERTDPTAGVGPRARLPGRPRERCGGSGGGAPPGGGWNPAAPRTPAWASASGKRGCGGGGGATEETRERPRRRVPLRAPPGAVRGGSPERPGGGLGSAGPAAAAGGRRRAAPLSVGGAAPSSRLRTLHPAAARLPPLTFIFARPFDPQ